MPASAAAIYVAIAATIATHHLVEQHLCPAADFDRGICNNHNLGLVLEVIKHGGAALTVIVPAGVAVIVRPRTSGRSFGPRSPCCCSLRAYFGHAGNAWSLFVAAVVGALVAAVAMRASCERECRLQDHDPLRDTAAPANAHNAHMQPMKSLGYPEGAVAALVLWATLGAARADTVDARCDIYPKGSDHATQVLACTFSQRQGYVRIQRSDGVAHDLRPVGQAPGNSLDQDGKPAYRQRGLGSLGQIYRLANESVYVYWSTVGLPGQAAPAPGTAAAPTATPPATTLPVPFDQTLSLLGVGFRVTSANSGSTNELTIVPTGLAIDNTPMVRTTDGQVVRAEVADLNADGSPEIYVVVRSAGSGSYGSLVAFSANKRKSLSELFMAPLTEHPTAAKGYMGHDEFAVVERRLVRRFPVYKAGDTNAAPSGGVRQLQYKLTRGEASWRLEIDRVVEY